jgi:hypothetical protein
MQAFVKHYFHKNSEKITKHLSVFRQFVKIAPKQSNSKICKLLSAHHEKWALVAFLPESRFIPAARAVPV